MCVCTHYVAQRRLTFRRCCSITLQTFWSPSSLDTCEPVQVMDYCPYRFFHLARAAINIEQQAKVVATRHVIAVAHQRKDTLCNYKKNKKKKDAAAPAEDVHPVWGKKSSNSRFNSLAPGARRSVGRLNAAQLRCVRTFLSKVDTHNHCWKIQSDQKSLRVKLHCTQGTAQ